MGKKLSTLTAGVMAAAFMASTIAPATFAIKDEEPAKKDHEIVFVADEVTLNNILVTVNGEPTTIDTTKKEPVAKAKEGDNVTIKAAENYKITKLIVENLEPACTKPEEKKKEDKEKKEEKPAPVCNIVVTDGSFTMIDKKLTATVSAEFEYAIISGGESTWIEGSEEGLTITGNGDFAEFVAVYVDDNKLGGTNYSAVEGSTKVTLDPAFLATLAAGTHQFAMEWENGTAETTFTILAASEDPEPTPEEKKVAPDTGATSVVTFAGVAVALTLGGAIVALKSKFNA